MTPSTNPNPSPRSPPASSPIHLRNTSLLKEFKYRKPDSRPVPLIPESVKRLFRIIQQAHSSCFCDSYSHPSTPKINYILCNDNPDLPQYFTLSIQMHFFGSTKPKIPDIIDGRIDQTVYAYPWEKPLVFSLDLLNRKLSISSVKPPPCNSLAEYLMTPTLDYLPDPPTDKTFNVPHLLHPVSDQFPQAKLYYGKFSPEFIKFNRNGLYYVPPPQPAYICYPMYFPPPSTAPTTSPGIHPTPIRRTRPPPQ